MSIHEMMSSATTSIRALEIQLDTAQRQLASTEADNERLRKANAVAEAGRLNAQADLVHFQTVFEANVCLEAMKICKKMFTLTHDNMLTEASEAVKRMVEEKQEQERAEQAVVVEGIESEAVVEVPAPASSQALEEGTVVCPPKHYNNVMTKKFYSQSQLGLIPANWSDRPAFVFRDGHWSQIERAELVPDNLKNYLASNGAANPSKNDLRGGVARTVLGAFGI